MGRIEGLVILPVIYGGEGKGTCVEGAIPQGGRGKKKTRRRSVGVLWVYKKSATFVSGKRGGRGQTWSQTLEREGSLIGGKREMWELEGVGKIGRGLFIMKAKRRTRGGWRARGYRMEANAGKEGEGKYF